MIRSNKHKLVSSRVMTVAAFAAIVSLLSILLLFMTTGCKSMEQEKRPMAVAHRGGAGLAPENTLAAFSAGLAYHPDMVELDIHLSKDGKLMVMHDPLLERTTGLPGAIGDFESTELAQIDAAATHTMRSQFGFQKIPTLEEVVDLVESSVDYPIGYQIEIKVRPDGTRYQEIEERLVELLTRRNLIDRTVVISFDFPSLQTVRELEPALKRGALISKKYMTEIGTGGPKAVASDIKSLGVDYVGINYNYLTPTLYDYFRKAKLGVGAWTVNEESAIKRFSEMGVDFITSDRPDLLRQVL